MIVPVTAVWLNYSVQIQLYRVWASYPGSVFISGYDSVPNFVLQIIFLLNFPASSPFSSPGIKSKCWRLQNQKKWYRIYLGHVITPTESKTVITKTITRMLLIFSYTFPWNQSSHLPVRTDVEQMNYLSLNEVCAEGRLLGRSAALHPVPLKYIYRWDWHGPNASC